MTNKKLLVILKIACFFLFIGRGWQHFYLDAPYRVFLWNESLLSPVITFFSNYTWQDYVSSDFINQITQSSIRVIGILYFLMGFITIFIKPWYKKIFKYYFATTIHLFILSLLITIDKGSYFGLFIEHTIQIFLPTVFGLLYFKIRELSEITGFVKLVIGFAFIGHGLFAVGFYPVPGNFVEMVISTFNISEIQAYTFLRIAGCIDFIAAIFLFIPRFQLFSLMFMSFWGTVTAFARIVSHFDNDLITMSLLQWLHETLYRIPHGFLPLFLILSFVLSNRKQVGNIKEMKLSQS